MSIFLDLTVQQWSERLESEGLVRLVQEDVELYPVHLEGFVRAFGESAALPNAHIMRLLTVSNEICRLYASFATQAHRLFFSHETRDQILFGLFGHELSLNLEPSRPQRRLLIQSEFGYSATILAELVTEVLAHASGEAIYRAQWCQAVEENRLTDISRLTPVERRSISQDNKARIWHLEGVRQLMPSEAGQLIATYPSVLRTGLGTAQFIISSAPQAAPTEWTLPLKHFVASHGLIRAESLHSLRERGVPLSSLINAAARFHLGTALDATVLSGLSARLEGFQWPQGRSSLVALLYLLEARGLLNDLDEAQFRDLMVQFVEQSGTSSTLSSPITLESYLSNALMSGRAFPDILEEFEREAYIFAARICVAEREDRALRLQDVANVLKSPRQTVSRKWHGFKIQPSEYSPIV